MKLAITHTQNLIRCPSVTPQEAGALIYMRNHLKAAGFTCHWLPFSEPGTPDVDNLYARVGTGTPHICFAGHTDVVPPGDLSLWRRPPFAAEIEDGMLWGRGAVDMKGALGAALAAVESFLAARGPDFGGSISFLLTGDEEGPAINGTRKVVQWLKARKERPDACILGECTSESWTGDTIKIGRRGSLNTLLTVHGVQGHVAYPDKARNPLPALIDVLALLKRTPLDMGSEHFQASNLEITSIDTGNQAVNVIPASVSARFNIRFNELHSSSSLKVWVEEKVNQVLDGTGIGYTLQFESTAESFLTGTQRFVKVLSAAVKAETGLVPELSTSGGTSDARFIKELCPVAELGLMNATAHKTGEGVPVDSLQRLASVYLRFLQLTFP